jgi:hypothetical protein
MKLGNAMKFFTRITTTVLTCSLLVACGGGGGGGGGTTVTPTADITAANALEVGYEVYTSSVFPQQLLFEVGLGSTAAATGSLGEKGILLSAGELAGALASDKSGGFPSGIVTPQERIPCLDGYVDTAILDDSPPVVTVRFTFVGCQDFTYDGLVVPGLVDGVMELTINLNSDEQLTAVFVAFTIDDSVTIDGDLRVIEKDLTGPGEIYHELSEFYSTRLEIVEGLFRVVLLNYDYSYEELLSATEDFDQEDFRGGITGVLFDGIVTFNTLVPFVYDYINQYYTQGEIVINGGNGDRIRVRVVDNSNDLIVEIDTDGDGEFDTNPDWTWSDIINGPPT